MQFLGSKRTILAGGVWQVALYCDDFAVKNSDLGPENTYLWNVFLIYQYDTLAR